MSKIELPPLPRPIYAASCGKDPFYTADHILADRRQIVELCASLCKSLMPQNDRSDWTEYAQMSADALSRAEDAIRSLLDEKKENE